MSTKRIATLNRGRGGAGYRQKRCFLKLRKDADRKRLFCSNVSTLLSMIVALASAKFKAFLCVSRALCIGVKEKMIALS